MTRWGHGHSIGTGVLVAVAFSGHLLWIVTVVFAVGFVCGRTWHLFTNWLGRTHRRRRLTL